MTKITGRLVLGISSYLEEPHNWTNISNNYNCFQTLDNQQHNVVVSERSKAIRVNCKIALDFDERYPMDGGTGKRSKFPFLS